MEIPFPGVSCCDSAWTHYNILTEPGHLNHVNTAWNNLNSSGSLQIPAGALTWYFAPANKSRFVLTSG